MGFGAGVAHAKALKGAMLSGTLSADGTKLFVGGTKKELDLSDMLKQLYAKGITSVFVEGGARTSGAFFDQGLVDKAYFFIALKVIGGRRRYFGQWLSPTPLKICKLR